MSGAQPQQQAAQPYPQQPPEAPAAGPGPQPQVQPHQQPPAYEAPQQAAAAGYAAGGYAAGPGATAGGGFVGEDADAVRRSRTGARTVPRTRKARLRVAKVDPWSVMKVSFLLAIALGLCTLVAVAVLWMVMDAMGVFSAVGGTISQATSTGNGDGFDLQAFLSLPRVLTFTGVVAVIDVILMTALATLGAFIYNLSAGFVGGIEVTLAEDE